MSLGYDVTVIDPDARFVRRIRELEPDFVFVAMHGRGGEDGTLQDLLEILGVPYTGSDVHASGRCLDKHSFKELMQAQGLATPGVALVQPRGVLRVRGRPRASTSSPTSSASRSC